MTHISVAQLRYFCYYSTQPKGLTCSSCHFPAPRIFGIATFPWIHARTCLLKAHIDSTCNLLRRILFVLGELKNNTINTVWTKIMWLLLITHNINAWKRYRDITMIICLFIFLQEYEKVQVVVAFFVMILACIWF